MEEIVKKLDEMSQKSEANKNEIKAEVKAEVDGVKTAVDEVKSSVSVVKDEVDKIKDEFTEMKKKAGQLKMEQNQEAKSFNSIIAETIEANVEQITNHKRGDGNRDLRLKGFEDANIKEVKAVGDMSTSANFTGASNYTTDVRTGIIETPYNKVWLSDILPGGTSSAASVLYPKENSGEGAAALWTDPTADKAQMDFDLTTKQAYFKWIAGYVIVAREMLDDIPFMLSYIQSRMLISLKKAENDLILNGSSDTNPVDGLLDVATAYDGSFTNKVDRLIDAGWGQIVEDTEDFYSPTHAILNPRDAVAIGLNKSSGSGEYDLPNGSVSFSQGNLQVAGINAVNTTLQTANNFVVFDAKANMFIRRMLPELRIFEDSTLAKKNKIMFRIEERATLINFNAKAVVKGLLTPA